MKTIEIGKRFGRLLIVSENSKRSKSRQIRYDCLCDCGNEVTTTGTSLRNGTLSCGCIRVEMLVERVTIHGLSKHKLFTKWYSLRERCFNESTNRHERYGGRGIGVCKEWMEGFMPFYNWAISNGWKPGLTIDRKDNDKGYSPENCHFVTFAENNRNMSTSQVWIVYGEEFASASLAGKAFGVCGATISRWCKGYVTVFGNFSPARMGCYARVKYDNS